MIEAPVRPGQRQIRSAKLDAVKLYTGLALTMRFH